jgi:hypothetical protein
MNMKKLLESMDNIEECGMNASADPMMAPKPADEGMPVSMNISLNASGEKNVSDLINMMKNAGMGGAAEVTPDMMPPRQDMERLRDIVDEPADGLAPDADQLPAEPEMEPSLGKEEIATDDEADVEGYANEPEPAYGDMSDVIPDGNDLNRKKKSHPPVAGGDNPMALADEDETTYAIRGKSPEAQEELSRKANAGSAMESNIKSKLMSALAEKKKQPDLNDDGKNDFKDVQIARKNAAAKAAAKRK